MKDKEIQGTYSTIKIKEERQVVQADKKNIKWEQDPLGYFLIKVDKKERVIRAGFCTNDNVMRKEIVGKNAEEICHTIIAHKLVSVLAHAANLGRELAKAEIALQYDLEYIQDDPLVLKKDNLNNEL